MPSRPRIEDRDARACHVTVVASHQGQMVLEGRGGQESIDDGDRTPPCSALRREVTPSVRDRFVNRQCARQLAHVKLERQAEILGFDGILQRLQHDVYQEAGAENPAAK